MHARAEMGASLELRLYCTARSLGSGVGTGPEPLALARSRLTNFSAASPAVKAAVVELLARHGVKERFEANSGGVLRSIMWDGTIITFSPSRSPAKLAV
jgi:hypothetical protein